MQSKSPTEYYEETDLSILVKVNSDDIFPLRRKFLRVYREIPGHRVDFREVDLVFLCDPHLEDARRERKVVKEGDPALSHFQRSGIGCDVEGCEGRTITQVAVDCRFFEGRP